MHRLLPVSLLLLASAAPSDPSALARAGSGCGFVWQATQAAPLPCAMPRQSIDGAARNGVLPLRALARPVRVTNAFRIVETDATTVARDVTIDGLIGENIVREGIRLKRGGTFERITIRNFALTHAAQPNVRPDLPEGIHIQAGQDILIENGTIRGFQMTADPKKYWNGDGIASERDARGLTIRNVAVLDNTDAGLDLKSPGNLLDNVYAAGNKRNIRLWADTHATTLTIGPVVKRGGSSSAVGIWIHGRDRPTVTIDTLILDMGGDGPPVTAVLVEDGPATLTIGRCIVRSMPPGSKLVAAPNKASIVRLGAGCRLLA